MNKEEAVAIIKKLKVLASGNLRYNADALISWINDSEIIEKKKPEYKETIILK